MDGKIVFRELDGIKEMVAAEALQKDVWESKNDYDNKDILVAIHHAGGLVGGAFVEETTMVGFILAFPTINPQLLHSHRLAVLPGFRNHHLGLNLKWFQRRWAMERGITAIQWTFDPLRAINADINIRHLGGIAKTYFEDYYGPLDGINLGIPSDRILVEWEIESPRVISLSGNIDPLDQSFDAFPANPLQTNLPTREQYDLDNPYIRINLPDDIGFLLIHDKPSASIWRLHIRRLLENYFARQYVITGFTRQNGPAYILEKISPDLLNKLII